MSFEEYLKKIEELLKITGREIPQRPAIPPEGFKL